MQTPSAGFKASHCILVIFLHVTATKMSFQISFGILGAAAYRGKPPIQLQWTLSSSPR